MVKAEREKTVLPKDSSWFEYYADGSGKTEDIVPLRESAIYKERSRNIFMVKIKTISFFGKIKYALSGSGGK